MVKADGTMKFNNYQGGTELKNFDVIVEDVREMVIVGRNAPETSFKLKYYGELVSCSRNTGSGRLQCCAVGRRA